jgi:hypothetical protein
VASYYVWSGASGSANGTSWTNAYTTLTTAFSGKVAGDVFYVAHDHAESTASAIGLATAGTVANPSKVICVNRAGSVPPVSSDRRTTATVTSTGSNITFGTGMTHYDGLIFIAGSGSSSSGIQVPQSAVNSGYYRFDNCSLRLGSTFASNRISLALAAGAAIELNNTTVSFANAGHGIVIANLVRWRNTPSALLGTMPTTLFLPVANGGSLIECTGVDFSAAGSGKTLIGALATAFPLSYKFLDCKLDSAVTKSAVPLSAGSSQIDFVRSGATGVNYTVHSHRINGLLIEETTIVRTGGASDGTTPIAWKVVTTANCSYSMPFECPLIAIWNDTTGSAVTATVEGIWGGGAVPNDDDIWLDVEYLGDASSPQGSFVNDGKADLLTTAAGQTSSSETWGGSTTKFKLACTFTPSQRGWVYARVRVGRASSTFYVDPLCLLS